MSFNPCYDKEYIEELFGGKKRLAPKTVLKMENVSAGDKIWLLCRNEFMTEKNQRLFACDCAEHTLQYFEEEYPNDKRPRNAIEVSRRYANGNATDKELSAAARAAYSAASKAAYSAAYSADYSAASSAAYWATYKASRAASWAASRAEREWQISKLAEYL